MGNKKGSKESRLSRYMKAPIRFLSKARDLYIQGMNHCSTHLAYVDAAIGFPTVRPVAAVPGSFSVGSATPSSSTDDYGDLVKAASVRTYKQPPWSPARPAKTAPVSRNLSVGIGRIDEDEPCDFKDDVMANPHAVYGRSRSYAVHRRAGLF